MKSETHEHVTFIHFQLFLSQVWEIFVFGVHGFLKVLPQFPGVARFMNVNAEDAQRFWKIGRDSFRVSN